MPSAIIDADLAQALENIAYPGFELNLLEMGLVRQALRQGSTAKVVLRSLAAPDEVKQEIRRQIENALKSIDGVLQVRILEAKMPRQAEPEPVAGIKTILAVASGKGGVGKSTVAVNLALNLKQEGLQTGLLDLDLYGPSLPLMLGLEGREVLSREGLIEPLVYEGLKVISGGLLAPPDKALLWKGPMLIKAVRQLLRQTAWGQLDVLVLDLPPGTGDIHMAVLREAVLSGAVIVTTPQGVAIIDVIKALDLFQRNQVPVLGLIENMSYFRCPDCGSRHEIFGHGSVGPLAEELGVAFLGELPLDPVLRQEADLGRPAPGAGITGPAWRNLARQVKERLFITKKDN